MAASAGMSGWLAGGVVVAAVSVVALGSVVLREANRPWSAPVRSASTAAADPSPPPAPAKQGVTEATRAEQAPMQQAPTRQARATGISPKPAPEATVPAIAFDVVRVDRSGSAVVAGHGAPKIRVALLDGDRVLDTVVSDASGQFVFLPPPLSSGKHVLRLVPAGAAPSAPVHVEVPRAEPAHSAVAAVAPPAAPGPAPPPVAIKTLRIDAAGGFFADGTGAAGHVLRIYLNGSFLAAVRPGDNGAWSLRIDTGVTPGRYQVRAEDVRDPDGKVLASADVAFEYAAKAPGEPAKGAPPGAPTPLKPSAPVARGADPPAQAAAPPQVPRVAGAAQPAGQAVSLRPSATVPVQPARAAAARAATVAQFAARPTIRMPAYPASGRIPRPPYAAGVVARPVPAAPRPPFAGVPAVRYGMVAPPAGRYPLFRPVRPIAVAAWRGYVPPRQPLRPQRWVVRGPVVAHAVVGAIRTVQVRPGDTMWGISERAYGSGSAYARVAQANALRVPNPQIIHVGETLVLPPAR